MPPGEVGDFLRVQDDRAFGLDPTNYRAEWQLVLNRPVLTGAEAQYEEVFLADVPLPNRYSVTVDWQGSPEPHRIFFNLLGNEREGSVAGDSGSIVYDMGSREFAVNGENSILVQAASGDGVRSPQAVFRMWIAAVPGWAGPAGRFRTDAASLEPS